MYIAFPCLKKIYYWSKRNLLQATHDELPPGTPGGEVPIPAPWKSRLSDENHPNPEPGRAPFPSPLPGRPRRGAARLRAVPSGPRTAPGPRHRLTSGGGPRLRHLAALPGRGPARGDPPVPPQLVPLPLG